MDIGVYETYQGGVLANFIWVFLDGQKTSLNRDAVRGCLQNIKNEVLWSCRVLEMYLANQKME